jgi:hypothetical protein
MDGLRYTDLIQYVGTLLETVDIGRVSLSGPERASLGDRIRDRGSI